VSPGSPGDGRNISGLLITLPNRGTPARRANGGTWGFAGYPQAGEHLSATEAPQCWMNA
jgi:hypothetical protein